jgi:ankyrin repeat protein
MDVFMDTKDPLAVAVVEAIHKGDVHAIKRLLNENPGLATVRLGGDTRCNSGEMSRTLLHVATDWPGHYHNGPQIIATLVAAGADVNAPFAGPHTETPLHWAASSDDVAVLDALLDHGADIEAPGAVIGGGTPLADAAAFGQWKAAHRLVERGAKTSRWQAATLGLIDRVREHFSGKTSVPPSPRPPQPDDCEPDEVTHAFWCACHGGQKLTAEYLYDLGADINWIGYDKLTPLGAASRSGANELVAWLIHHGAKSTEEIRGCV